MFYHLLYPLSRSFFAFNVTRYITFRGGCAFVVSFFIVIVLRKFFLNKLKKLKITEHIDMYGHIRLESLHGDKKGTPTMGGLLIIFSVLISTLLWARLDNYFVWLILFVMVALGLLGLADDYLKIRKARGLSRKRKLVWQGMIGLVLGLFLVINKEFPTTLNFPFFKNFVIELGAFYIFWVVLMLLSTSNAVNFTDGLDGLAIGALIINFLILGTLSYVVGNVRFADYLLIPYMEGAGELTVVCLSLIGAGLGFLWFNSYPAELFMGDVGALALGGMMGAIALLIKEEFVLFISGGLFVLEAMSVILQILSVKLRKKRLFRAAPLHHHFQILGWAEPKIIIRFWIITIMFVVIALLTLKIR